VLGTRYVISSLKQFLTITVSQVAVDRTTQQTAVARMFKPYFLSSDVNLRVKIQVYVSSLQSRAAVPRFVFGRIPSWPALKGLVPPDVTKRYEKAEFTQTAVSRYASLLRLRSMISFALDSDNELYVTCHVASNGVRVGLPCSSSYKRYMMSAPNSVSTPLSH
jgi:hexokinase